MSQPHIVFVDDVQVRTMMLAAGTEMAKRGCIVQHYANMTELAADRESLEHADVLVVSSNQPCGRPIMSVPTQLRAVVFPASGTETIDLKAATDLGIIVGHGAFPENAQSMAESTIMLMLVGMYDLHRSESLLRGQQPRPRALYARMLKGRTIGFVGFGHIGTAIALRLQGWDARLIAHSPSAASRALPLGVEAVALDTLMAQSDIVCVVSALNDQTRGLINERRLRLMKPSSILVNTARGAIIDEAALHRVLEEKRIAMAALDTFTVEPLPADSPLRNLDNVVLTPHIVGHTIDTIAAAEQCLIDGIAQALRGEPPPYIRNPEALPAWKARWSAIS